MTMPERTLELHQLADQTLETMRAAVGKAQAESRQLGVPLSYSINGVQYFEMPNGEITRENPWKQPEQTKKEP